MDNHDFVTQVNYYDGKFLPARFAYLFAEGIKLLNMSSQDIVNEFSATENMTANWISGKKIPSLLYRKDILHRLRDLIKDQGYIKHLDEDKDK